MKLFKTKNLIYKLIVIAFIVYSIIIFANQQTTLNAYKNNNEYYAKQIEEEVKYKELLLSKKENIDSIESIEEIATTKCDMFRPNDILYVDIDK